MKDSAVLLIDCPDQKGLVARVSSLLYRHGANILHADQHQDHELGLFFMRVEWALNGSADHGDSAAAQMKTPSKTPPRATQPQAARFDLAAFETEFAPLAAELEMRWQLTSSDRLPRVALFCSQYLHCMADLLYRWRAGELECEIPLIVSNHREVESLAAFYGVPFEHVEVTAGHARRRPKGGSSNCSLNMKLSWWFLPATCRFFRPAFIARYPSAIINVHHSFLPAFTGAKPYHAAHARGVKLIGATSHYVTEVLDDGPIIEQDVARVSHRDQVEDLVARGRDLERMVLSRAVRWHLDRRILCYGNKTVVFD